MFPNREQERNIDICPEFCRAIVHNISQTVPGDGVTYLVQGDHERREGSRNVGPLDSVL